MNIAAIEHDIDLDEEKKTAEEYLIHYTVYKKQLEEKRQTIIESSPNISDIPIREKYAHGDSTANKAKKLLNNAQMRIDCWLRAAEATRKHFDEQINTNHRDYIKMRYDEGMTPRTIANELGIGVRTVFAVRDELLNYMAFAHLVYEKSNIFLRDIQKGK
jgi:hypothetical protein